MKKILASVVLAGLATSASAINYVSVDVESVKGREGATDSVAQYVRAGTELGGIQFGVQGRTARFDGGNLVNSLEITGGKAIGALTPFVGVGHDNGFNGASPFNYAIVGATAGVPVGPGFALVGVKTRVGSTEDTMTKQTLAFGTYSIPMSKTVSFNVNASRSFQDIKEDAVGVGLSFSF